MRVFFLYFSRWYVRVPTASVLSVIQCIVVVSDDMSFLDCQMYKIVFHCYIFLCVE